MSTLKDAGGSELPVFTCNELAAEVGMTWGGLSKWLASRPRYRPLFVLTTGTKSTQLWAVHTAHDICQERDG